MNGHFEEYFEEPIVYRSIGLDFAAASEQPAPSSKQECAWGDIGLSAASGYRNMFVSDKPPVEVHANADVALKAKKPHRVPPTFEKSWSINAQCDPRTLLQLLSECVAVSETPASLTEPKAFSQVSFASTIAHLHTVDIVRRDDASFSVREFMFPLNLICVNVDSILVVCAFQLACSAEGSNDTHCEFVWQIFSESDSTKPIAECQFRNGDQFLFRAAFDRTVSLLKCVDGFPFIVS
jgi:hypothetical protein